MNFQAVPRLPLGARRRGQQLVEPKDVIVIDARVADGVQGAKDGLVRGAAMDKAKVLGRNARCQRALDGWSDGRERPLRVPPAVGNDVVERGWIGKRIDDLLPEMLDQISPRRHDRLLGGPTLSEPRRLAAAADAQS